MSGPAVLIVAEQLRRRIPGGIGTYATGLLHGLEALGDEAGTVVAYASRAPRRGDDRVAAAGLAARVSPLPAPLLTRLWDRRLLRAPRGFDVVHATSLAFPSAAGGKKLVVCVHDLAWREHPEAYPPRGRRWHENALVRGFAEAAHLVTPSQAVADDLVAAGYDGAKVTVIAHGSDHLPEPDEAGAGAVLEALGVRGGFLLAVGTLEPRKNLAGLAAAYLRARRSMPEPWPLVVVGPAGWGAAPQGEGVVVAGTVDAAVLAALYRRARLLAYVPYVEGFGLPPLEAMVYGTPVVSSPMPSTEGAAFDVDPTDVDAMAQALVAVATDEALRTRLSHAGLARSARRLWVDVAREHVALWRAVA